MKNLIDYKRLLFSVFTILRNLAADERPEVYCFPYKRVSYTFWIICLYNNYLNWLICALFQYNLYMLFYATNQIWAFCWLQMLRGVNWAVWPGAWPCSGHCLAWPCPSWLGPCHAQPGIPTGLSLTQRSQPVGLGPIWLMLGLT